MFNPFFDFYYLYQVKTRPAGFWSFTQNWFDIVTLVLTLLALWLAFWLGERGYRREKKDAQEEEKKLQQFEIELLSSNLKQLNKAITEQIIGLKNYVEVEQFSLDFKSGVQVDFLRFLDIRNVYRKYGFNDQKAAIIKDLFQELYQLKDFRSSLRNSVRSYISRYTDLEPSFYSYRKLMYKKHHQIAMERSQEIQNVSGGFYIKFGNDVFAEAYFQLAQKINADPELTDENGNVIRKNVISLFIMPLIELCQKFVPVDKDAIEIIDIANEVRSTWINMETITEAHFQEINGHINQLEEVKKKIGNFLEL